jgi:putative DNA primase/helicase
MNADADLLVVQNGILQLSTRHLLSHSPEKVFTIGLPVTYLPSAFCPAVETFFNQIVKPCDVNLLYELCGWCLDRKSPIQKLFFMLGSGANGKSTYLNLLQKFLGPENCSSASIQSLADNRFAMAQLSDKWANIFPDLPASGIKDAAMIKGLTGGDTMQAEHKFEKPFNLTNTAKLIFSANKAPRFNEDSDAIWRRLVIVEFPNQFMGNRADCDLLDKLTTPQELSGLLNASLDALQTLRERKSFSVSASMTATRRQYLVSSNPVSVFIEERCEKDSKASITKEDLYQAFVAFCNEVGAEPIGKKAFGGRLNAMGVADEAQNSWSIHIWKGLKLKDKQVPPNN